MAEQATESLKQEAEEFAKKWDEMAKKGRELIEQTGKLSKAFLHEVDEFFESFNNKNKAG